MVELIGYIAAILTASTMMPQIIKSFYTKNIEDISTTMLTMYTINAGLWVSYGLLIGAEPIVVADGVACCAGITQLTMKLKYYRRQMSFESGKSLNRLSCHKSPTLRRRLS